MTNIKQSISERVCVIKQHRSILRVKQCIRVSISKLRNLHHRDSKTVEASSATTEIDPPGNQQLSGSTAHQSVEAPPPILSSSQYADSESSSTQSTRDDNAVVCQRRISSYTTNRRLRSPTPALSELHPKNPCTAGPIARCSGGTIVPGEPRDGHRTDVVDMPEPLRPGRRATFLHSPLLDQTFGCAMVPPRTIDEYGTVHDSHDSDSSDHSTCSSTGHKHQGLPGRLLHRKPDAESIVWRQTSGSYESPAKVQHTVEQKAFRDILVKAYQLLDQTDQPGARNEASAETLEECLEMPSPSQLGTEQTRSAASTILRHQASDGSWLSGHYAGRETRSSVDTVVHNVNALSLHDEEQRYAEYSDTSSESSSAPVDGTSSCIDGPSRLRNVRVDGRWAPGLFLEEHLLEDLCKVLHGHRLLSKLQEEKTVLNHSYDQVSSNMEHQRKRIKIEVAQLLEEDRQLEKKLHHVQECRASLEKEVGRVVQDQHTLQCKVLGGLINPFVEAGMLAPDDELDQCKRSWDGRLPRPIHSETSHHFSIGDPKQSHVSDPSTAIPETTQCQPKLRHYSGDVGHYRCT